MLAALFTGIVLGFSAGIAPGPLLALVISETLQHGVRSGLKVALAPLITDLPIVLATLVLLAQVKELHTILGLLSVFGAGFIAYLGWEAVRFRPRDVALASARRDRSLQKAVLANALSPNPYLFWLSVGGPIVFRTAEASWPAAIAFVAVFYLLLVGSKIVVALLAGHSRSLLGGSGYAATMRGLGLALWVLAVLLLYEGLQMMAG
jgi:threonine/homoserine/homoserine lactone efflux protein